MKIFLYVFEICTGVMTKTVLAVTIAAILTVSILVFPLNGVDAMESFLDVEKTKIVTDSSELEEAQFEAKGNMPTDGTGGAFGYGVITGAGLNAIIVTTTHGGVLDSEAQTSASDPVFHNHYVALQDSTVDGSGLCPGLEVRDITWQQPGDVQVNDEKVTMEDTPYYFAGTHSLSSAPISFLADENVSLAVSFTIDPVDGSGDTSLNDIQAVCINEVATTEKLKVSSENNDDDD